LEIVERIRASDCVEASMDEARRFAAQAQEALERLPDNDYRRAMHGIVDYSINRDI